MFGLASGDVEVSVGERTRQDKRRGLDAIRNNAVFRAMQLRDALHANRGRARTFDLRSHFVEQVGEVGDFGLARAILHDGLAVCKSCCHEQVFGSGDRDFVENNFGAFQALCGSLDVTVVLGDGGSEPFQTHQVEIDGAGADGAASGQGNASGAAARHQRPEHECGSTHRLHQFVGSLGRAEVATANGGAMLGAAVSEFDFGSHGGKQFARGLNVADLRDVFQDDRIFGEQGGRHRRQGRVFCPADANGAEEWISTANYEFIHKRSVFVRARCGPQPTVLSGTGLEGVRRTAATVYRKLATSGTAEAVPSQNNRILIGLPATTGAFSPQPQAHSPLVRYPLLHLLRQTDGVAHMAFGAGQCLRRNRPRDFSLLHHNCNRNDVPRDLQNIGSFACRNT